MQSTTDIIKLRDAMVSRARLLQRIVDPISNPLGSEDRRAIAYVTIELDNMIVMGLRQYTKSSLLRSRTAAGIRITSSVEPRTTEEAAAYIYSALRPQEYVKKGSPPSIAERDEIYFRDPKDAEKVLLRYTASNIGNFATALSLNATVFGEAKIFRHFFAHRTKNTYEAIEKFSRDLGLGRVVNPEEFLFRGRPGSGVRFVHGWLAEVKDFFDFAA